MYFLRRLAQAVPVMIGASILTFLVVVTAPGDPAALMVDFTQLTPEQQREVRQQLGLEDPLPIRYWKMMSALVTGQLKSMRTNEATLQMVADAMPVTLLIVATSIGLGVVTGVALGVMSALQPYSRLDDALTLLALFGLSVPGFWLALVLIFLFAENLHWLPAAGLRSPGSSSWDPFEIAPYLVLPTLVTGSSIVATMTRYSRSSMLEALGQDYVRTARAKGLAERRVIYVHAFRNAAISVVTLIGVLIPILLSGSVVVETVFALPGMGLLTVTAARQRDYPVVMTAAMLSVALVILFNLLTDALYTVVDPRIRLR